MKSAYPNINTLWAEVFVDECARNGIRHVIISPGSRSTPLALAFAGHPDITDHSIIDERSAAFFALGLAKACGKAVGLLCTSGTAAANYFPAICEADLSQVPLLVCTADRPVHERDAGTPQTMDQVKLYGDHVRWFHDVAHPEADEKKLCYLRNTASYAIALAEHLPAGPVHVNFPFRKPLEPTPSDGVSYASIPSDFVTTSGIGFHGRSDGRPFSEYSFPAIGATERDVQHVATIIRQHSRVLLIAGPDANGKKYRDALTNFSSVVGIPVFAEAASQQRYRTKRHANILGCSDLLLRSQPFRALAHPGLLILLGSTPTNNAMQSFLRGIEGVPRISISPSLQRFDHDHMGEQHVIAESLQFLDAITSLFVQNAKGKTDTAWLSALVKANDVAERALQRYLLQQESVFEAHYHAICFSLLPDDCAVFVSNSMPVRDMETFLPRTAHDVDLYFNRGVNGIDGIVSTSMGIARSRRNHTLLLTGDLAFIHDIHGLMAASRCDVRATIVVLNNNGGEIFSLLPVGKIESTAKKHFLTPHDLSIRLLAQAYGANHVACHNTIEFQDALRNSWDGDGVTVIEVRTTISESKQRRLQLLQAVVREIDASLPQHEHSEPGFTKPLFHLSYSVLRHASSKTGTPLVFLHGFTRSAVSWKQLAALVKSDATLYAFDLMGHGRSPKPDQTEHADVYGFDYQSARLEDAFEQCGLGRIHLIGYSMGGRLALHFATQFPERLTSLTLISASPGIADDAERTRRSEEDEALARRITEQGLERFVNDWMNNPVFCHSKGRDALRFRDAKAERMTQSVLGLAASLRGSGQGQQSPLWEALASITTPVQLIVGAHDAKYCSIAKAMHDRLPNANLHIIENAGHDVSLDCPEAVSTVLDRIIKSYSC